ncbi:MAG: M48 family metalloprotease, partial [Candidatus Rokuibacteriota bacterium]
MRGAGWSLGVVGCVGIACLGLAGCAARVPGAVDRGGLVERAETEEAGLLRRVKVYDDPRLLEYLAGIADRLGGQRIDAGAGPARVRITVIQDPTLGAFALPRGRLFLHTGLLSRVETEGQLAAVLAWEMARDAWKPPERSGKASGVRAALG